MYFCTITMQSTSHIKVTCQQFDVSILPQPSGMLSRNIWVIQPEVWGSLTLFSCCNVICWEGEVQQKWTILYILVNILSQDLMHYMLQKYVRNLDCPNAYNIWPHLSADCSRLIGRHFRNDIAVVIIVSIHSLDFIIRSFSSYILGPFTRKRNT